VAVHNASVNVKVRLELLRVQHEVLLKATTTAVKSELATEHRMSSVSKAEHDSTPTNHLVTSIDLSSLITSFVSYSSQQASSIPSVDIALVAAELRQRRLLLQDEEITTKISNLPMIFDWDFMAHGINQIVECGYVNFPVSQDNEGDFTLCVIPNEICSQFRKVLSPKWDVHIDAEESQSSNEEGSNTHWNDETKQLRDNVDFNDRDNENNCEPEANEIQKVTSHSTSVIDPTSSDNTKEVEEQCVSRSAPCDEHTDVQEQGEPHQSGLLIDMTSPLPSRNNIISSVRTLRLKQDVEQLLLSNKFKRTCPTLEVIDGANNNDMSLHPCFVDYIQNHLLLEENHSFTLFLSTPLNKTQNDIVAVRAQRHSENSVLSITKFHFRFIFCIESVIDCQ